MKNYVCFPCETDNGSPIIQLGRRHHHRCLISRRHRHDLPIYHHFTFPLSIDNAVNLFEIIVSFLIKFW